MSNSTPIFYFSNLRLGARNGYQSKPESRDHLFTAAAGHRPTDLLSSTVNISNHYTRSYKVRVFVIFKYIYLYTFKKHVVLWSLFSKE